MLKIIAVTIAATLLLAGCGTIDMSALGTQMENRVTTTLDCGRGFFTSLWGPFGFTSEIDKKDVVRLPCGGAAAK